MRAVNVQNGQSGIAKVASASVLPARPVPDALGGDFNQLIRPRTNYRLVIHCLTRHPIKPIY